MSNINIVAFDVDGVLADFVGQFVHFYNHAHPDDLITPAKIRTYDYQQGLKYKEALSEIPGFYSTMPVMEDAQIIFPRIAERFETLIVTAIPANRANERLLWFDIFFPWFNKNNIIFETDKSKVSSRFDVIFEDHVENIDAIGPEKCVVYTQLHNAGYSTALGRVNSWQDIGLWLEQNAC